MIKRRYPLLLLTGLLWFSLSAQTIYRTNVSNPMIRTLQVKVADSEFSNPYISLNGENRIVISFDAMTHDYQRYLYKIVHCNADWTPSDLLPIEYMDGFEGVIIEDNAPSMATTTHYTNYRVVLPNDDIRFKVSGNYAVQIYREEQPDQPIATACFSVIEPLVTIAGSISGNTDIDFNREHQQLSFTIQSRDFSIPYPQSDLKISVLQNNRLEKVALSLPPARIISSQFIYEHNRELIFEAGNEFRRIEFLTNQYNGMNIDKIRYHAPYYHVDVMRDLVRANKSYVYDQDQNGRFFIRCRNSDSPDTEADYYIVHFSLQSGLFPGGDVYLSGDMLHQALDESSQMSYNAESGCYEKAILLKGGNYNYQYVFVPKGQTTPLTAPVEGNYYQTENEYTILIYYRPMGARYDRLIGKGVLQNSMNYMK